MRKLGADVFEHFRLFAQQLHREPDDVAEVGIATFPQRALIRLIDGGDFERLLGILSLLVGGGGIGKRSALARHRLLAPPVHPLAREIACSISGK